MYYNNHIIEVYNHISSLILANNNVPNSVWKLENILNGGHNVFPARTEVKVPLRLSERSLPKSNRHDFYPIAVAKRQVVKVEIQTEVVWRVTEKVVERAGEHFRLSIDVNQRFEQYDSGNNLHTEGNDLLGWRTMTPASFNHSSLGIRHFHQFFIRPENVLDRSLEVCVRPS